MDKRSWNANVHESLTVLIPNKLIKIENNLVFVFAFQCEINI